VIPFFELERAVQIFLESISNQIVAEGTRYVLLPTVTQLTGKWQPVLTVAPPPTPPPNPLRPLEPPLDSLSQAPSSSFSYSASRRRSYYYCSEVKWGGVEIHPNLVPSVEERPCQVGLILFFFFLVLVFPSPCTIIPNQRRSLLAAGTHPPTELS
jgi:hypothetical protein